MFSGRPLSEVKSDEKLWANGISVIELFYDDLVVESSVESIADKISSLISDLGGQFGLWLGLSMISLVEMFYLIGYYLTKVRRCSNK